jgi:signal transduction histidine kinase
MLGQAFIFGILVFQVLYVLMQWHFFRRLEFLYYELYLVLFIMFLYAYYEPQIGLTQFFGNDLERIKAFTRIEGLLIFYSYVIFAKYFTEAEKIFPDIARMMRRLEYFLLTGFTAQILLMPIVGDNNIREIFSWFFFVPGFIYGSFIGLKLIKKRVQLNTYVIVGSLFAIAGAFVQAVLDATNYYFSTTYHTSSLIMELGFICEFIFLNIGFLYKNKLLQQEQNAAREALLKATLEKSVIAAQLNDVRTKLSMDLHDDVSSSLSSIRILSTMSTGGAYAGELGTKLRSALDDLAQKVGVLVWSFNEKNDTVQQFVEYAKAYIETAFECSNYGYTVTASLADPAALIDGNIRKQLFLCLKEAIHNIIKHAQGTKVAISFRFEANRSLEICIKDNGISFDSTQKAGNGIANIHKRMTAIGGTVTFAISSGTTVALRVGY